MSETQDSDTARDRIGSPEALIHLFGTDVTPHVKCHHRPCETTLPHETMPDFIYTGL